MPPQTFIERLTPLDLLMPRTYINALLAFPVTSATSELSSTFQAGLDNISAQIPWLRGKVFPTVPTLGEKPGLEIRWTADDAAPQLINKSPIEASYENLKAEGFQTASIPQDVWPVPAMIDEETSQAGAPVFAASLFRFSGDEGVGICLSAHHNAVDGAGLAHIVRLLADNVANPGKAATVTPSAMISRNSRLRSALRLCILKLELEDPSKTTTGELFALHPAYSSTPPALFTESPQSTTSVLSIPMSRINQLKSALKATSTQSPSTNTLVCALVWAAITRARLQRNPALKDAELKLLTAVNGRKRISDDFSTAEAPYLGNVVMYAQSPLSAKEALAVSGGSTAALETICAAISHSQSESTINANSISEAYALASQVGDYRMMFPGWDLFGSRDLCITSWAGLDVYQDFGAKLGKPEFVRTPYAEADGVALVLPRRNPADQVKEAEELIDISVMLRRDDLAILKQNRLWEYS